MIYFAVLKLSFRRAFVGFALCGLTPAHVPPATRRGFLFGMMAIDRFIALRNEARRRVGAFEAGATLLFQCLLRGV